jgi:hypothetical protein
MNESPQVSVIMPCRNEARYIVPVLEAILRQQAPAGGFEVIVADGLSTDGTRDPRPAGVGPRPPRAAGGQSRPLHPAWP